MNRLRHLRARVWMVPVGIVLLILSHGAVLYYVSSHMAVSAVAISVVVVLVVIKHLGLLAPLYALFRRHFVSKLQK